MNVQKIIGLLLVTLLSAGVTQAAPPKAAKATAKVTADTTLKKVEGQVKWTGYGVGKSHGGTIDIKSGEIKLKNNEITSAEFVLDMTTLNTPDSDKLKTHLKSADFFEVEKYNEAKFKTTKVEVTKNLETKLGVTNYALTGDLTIKGKTEPITFLATVNQDGQKFSTMANAEISDRTKYGIVYNSKQFETVSKLGNKLIEDNIKIEIEAKAQ
jgi:polyisoprenoid-binding protein YceI